MNFRISFVLNEISHLALNVKDANEDIKKTPKLTDLLHIFLLSHFTTAIKHFWSFFFYIHLQEGWQ